VWQTVIDPTTGRPWYPSNYTSTLTNSASAFVAANVTSQIKTPYVTQGLSRPAIVTDLDRTRPVYDQTRVVQSLTGDGSRQGAVATGNEGFSACDPWSELTSANGPALFF
jgi:hypothetical protein